MLLFKCLFHIFSVISALPSTNAGMIYGRAALLGLVSGENNCQTAYPKCPRNEDDLLYYLNNHRGGFFRFFNGGAAFGDDTNYQYQPNYPQQHHQQQQQQQQHYNQQNYYQQQQQQHHQQPQYQNPQEESSLQTGLAVLQNIADAVNNGGGINLSNLAANGNLFGGLAGLLNGPASNAPSNSGGFDLNSLNSNAGLLGNLVGLVGQANRVTTPKPPTKPPVDDKGESLTELVGNLLTGFVGQRFAGRKITKRSIDVNEFSEDDDLQSIDEDPQVEGRILNKRPKIYAADDERDDRFRFQSNRPGYGFSFIDRITAPTPVPAYPINQQYDQFAFQQNQNINNDEFRLPFGHRSPKLVKFHNTADQFNQNGYVQRPEQYDDYDYRPTKMIFPDRTGTGNLKFDHDEFVRPTQGNRYGKILNNFENQQRPNGNRVQFDQENNNNYQYQQNYRPIPSNNYYGYEQNNNYNTRPNYNQNQINFNRNEYNSAQNNRRYPTYNRYGSNTHSNRQQLQHDYNSSQNVYVTNSQGQIEYYINAQGKKVYI